jgi:tetratricopeptide (TPR) repeat protein
MGKPGSAAFERGYSYALQRRYELAASAFSTAIKLEPKSIEYYVERSRAYVALQDWKRAIEDFDKILKLDPRRDDIVLERARAFLQTGSFGAALMSAVEYLERVGPDADGFHCRAKAYLLTEDYNDAIGDLTAAIALRPDSQFFLLRAQAHFDNDCPAEAIEDFERAFALCSTPDACDIERQGSAHLSLDQFEQAYSCFSQALSLEETAARYYYRGYATAQSGRRTEALADFRRAVAMDEYYRSPELYVGLVDDFSFLRGPVAGRLTLCPASV